MMNVGCVRMFVCGTFMLVQMRMHFISIVCQMRVRMMAIFVTMHVFVFDFNMSVHVRMSLAE